ncbi:hypothetical protein CPB86DRAFT_777856 [Serendipita vermifera]|nr:hypothetical protein CPB86DRAFT_777856 [Serendipita vermifera]
MSIFVTSPAGPSRVTLPLQHRCLVCWEEGEDFPDEPLTPQCKHPSQTCVKCVYGTVRAQLDLERSRDVCCPTPECRATLSHNDIKRWSEIADFERYDRRLTRSALSMQMEFVNCLNPKCNNGQLHPMGEKEPIVKCHSCGEKQCFIHDVLWHNGLTCEEYDRGGKRKRIEKRTRRLIEGISKPCPNCRVSIEKIEGCDIMACKCGHAFCYNCGKSMNKIQQRGNHKHARRCAHYAPKDTNRKVRFWQFWKRGWWRRSRWNTVLS